MFRSIRFRIALWYMVVFGATYALLSVLIYLFVAHMLQASLDEMLSREVRWVGARMERYRSRIEPEAEARDEIREHASFSPMKEFIEVWDSAGHIFYHSRILGPADTLAPYLARAEAGEMHEGVRIVPLADFRTQQLRLGAMSTPGGAKILLGMPTDGMKQAGDRLIEILLWLSPLVVAAGAGGGMIFARTTFAKVNDVIRTAERINADRLSERIPPVATRDEIGRMVATFNDMISRLDVAFSHMKQFTADASHELRTPLTVMRSQLEGALTDGLTTAELRMTIAKCHDETLRMTRIVEDLLLLARADAGMQTIRRDPVDLGKLLLQTYDESVVLASAKEIGVELRSEWQPVVTGDEERLHRMLLNLIDNAIKYTQRGGTITLALGRRNGSAEIAVADNGIGIPADVVPRIFDRFYRVDPGRSREAGGSGLGLSIARWIADAHGGSIAVASAPNEGSIFTVLLPLGGDAAPASAPPKPSSGARR